MTKILKGFIFKMEMERALRLKVNLVRSCWFLVCLNKIRSYFIYLLQHCCCINNMNNITLNTDNSTPSINNSTLNINNSTLELIIVLLILIIVLSN